MEPTAAISQEWALFETRAKALLELLDIAISSTNALHSQLEGSRARYEKREARKRAAKRTARSARVSGRVRRKRARSRSAAG
jgi:hypothetical protein